jgi:hypothetical protein
MQQQELAIKQAEVQRKAQKDQIDAALREKQQQIETGRILSQQELERQKLLTEKELELLKLAAEMRNEKERDVVKMGVDIAKQLSSQAHQKDITGKNK